MTDPVGAGVAFESPEKKRFPVCHACGKQHEGGYLKCRNITDEIRGKVDKLVKAGVFIDKSDGGGGKPTTARTTGTGKPTYKKQGPANTVVKEKYDVEETEAKESVLKSIRCWY